MQPITFNPTFHVDYRLSHLSKDSSLLVINTNSDSYSISLRAYSGLDQKVVLFDDIIMVDNKQNQNVEKRFKIVNPLYFLEITLRDNASGAIFRDGVMADRNKNHDFIQVKMNNDYVLQKNIPLNSDITISHPTAPHLWISYYDKTFKTTPVPYSDKGFIFNPEKNKTDMAKLPPLHTIKLEGLGLYFIQTDTSSQEGVFVNVFDDDFPKINSHAEMIEATRYISTNAEYKDMLQADSPKSAIDNFWLNRSNDKEYAKELIKKYYTRVQVANRDFTTYKEGWKTDRGMIYMIFGEPEEIWKKADQEIWAYDSTGKRPSLRFVFKYKNGQTLLQRNGSYKRSWDVEVYEWRKGIINEQ